MKKIFSKLILKIMGWNISSPFPNFKKYIIVFAPHTSSWDFIIGRCFAYTLQIQPNYLVKSELFFWPLSLLIKRNGGIPVYRKTGERMVDQVVERIKKLDKIILVIAPEGTRKKVKKWKTGFYYIAQKAEVPVALVFMDYSKKEVGIFDVLYPSDDLQNDLRTIENYYKEVKGRNPKQFNPKIY